MFGQRTAVQLECLDRELLSVTNVWTENCYPARMFGQRTALRHECLDRELLSGTNVWTENCYPARMFGQRTALRHECLDRELLSGTNVWTENCYPARMFGQRRKLHKKLQRVARLRPFSYPPCTSQRPALSASLCVDGFCTEMSIITKWTLT